MTEPDEDDRDDRDQDDLCDGCNRPRRTCLCETDPRQQPCDMSADDWRELYADPDYPDDDQEP